MSNIIEEMAQEREAACRAYEIALLERDMALIGAVLLLKGFTLADIEALKAEAVKQ